MRIIRTVVTASVFAGVMLAGGANLGTGKVTSVTGNGGSCVAGPNGNSVQSWEVAAGGSYTITVSGITECTTPTTFTVKNSFSGNVDGTDVSCSSGTCTFKVAINSNACETMPITYSCGSDTYFARRNDGGSFEAHLRTNTFNGSCTSTGVVSCTTCDPNVDPTCGQQQEPPTLTICKFYDSNNNGLPDVGEPFLNNWPMNLAPPGGVTGDFLTTGGTRTGCTQLSTNTTPPIAANGSYTVTETLCTPYNVTATIVNGVSAALASTTASITVQNTQTNEVDFGNNCPLQGMTCKATDQYGATVSANCTIGFYKNNCGGRTDKVGTCANNSYNLGSGGSCSTTGVTGCTAIANVLNGASASDMLIMLKAQELATKLNTCQNSGLLSAYVVFPAGSPLLGILGLPDSGGGATVQKILQYADTFIGGLSSCNLTAISSDRSLAEAYKNIFDLINNYPGGASGYTGVTIINGTPCKGCGQN